MSQWVSFIHDGTPNNHGSASLSLLFSLPSSSPLTSPSSRSQSRRRPSGPTTARRRATLSSAGTARSSRRTTTARRASSTSTSSIGRSGSERAERGSEGEDEDVEALSLVETRRSSLRALLDLHASSPSGFLSARDETSVAESRARSEQSALEPRSDPSALTKACLSSLDMYRAGARRRILAALEDVSMSRSRSAAYKPSTASPSRRPSLPSPRPRGPPRSPATGRARASAARGSATGRPP